MSNRSVRNRVYTVVLVYVGGIAAVLRETSGVCTKEAPRLERGNVAQANSGARLGHAALYTRRARMAFLEAPITPDGAECHRPQRDRKSLQWVTHSLVSGEKFARWDDLTLRLVDHRLVNRSLALFSRNRKLFDPRKIFIFLLGYSSDLYLKTL